MHKPGLHTFQQTLISEQLRKKEAQMSLFEATNGEKGEDQDS